MNSLIKKIASRVFLFNKKDSVLKEVVELINVDDTIESRKCLQQYFNHNNLKELGFVEVFFEKYKDLRGSVKNAKEFSNYAINMLNVLHVNIFDYYHWILLTKIFGSLGFLELSFNLREKSIVALLSNYKYEKDKLLVARAALDHGDMRLTKQLLEHAHVAKWKSADLKLFKDYLLITEGIPGCPVFPPDSPLVKIVNGKTVNVIGPANNLINIDIDDKQSVNASTGYVGKQSLPSGQDIKISVSFYARTKVRQILCSDDRMDQAKKVECLIVKRKEDLKTMLGAGFSASQLMVRYDFKNLLFMTSPNAGPELVYNCLLSGAKKVKIFNTDFFLTRSYPSGYITYKTNKNVNSNGFDMDSTEYCRIFSCVHHPAAQLRFYRNLMKSNLVIGDHVFNQTIAMPISKYFEKLDALYGFGTWGNY